MPPEAGFTVGFSGEALSADAAERGPRIATVTLSRPEHHNAQTPDTWLWLAKLGTSLPASVRILFIRGAGPSFSAGLDRATLAPASDGHSLGLFGIAHAGPEQGTAAISAFQSAFQVGSRPDLVSIALVQGYAIGAGFQLALSCDFRIASEDVVFSMAEVTLGLVPDLGGTKRLVELVGYSRAASICLTGRRVSAAEADQLGLVSAVVPASQLEAAGQQFAEQILALPRTAVTETKALLLNAAERSQEQQESAERHAQYRQLRILAGLEAED
ncbi:MAG: Enoyl-CoA hydratase/isomerase [Frankiales bacterium]|nr:Enoyl-CoA hydratase/isomerase [Frankiales bacterium]